MKNRITRLSSLFLLSTFLQPGATAAQDEAPWGGLSKAIQIALAVQAAPAEMRADATVQGWSEAGEFVTLREGSNDLVCMAPTPTREDLEVSCHHLGLEPFFERGRELSAAGITGNERVQKRWDEFEAGTLSIPFGSVNYILTGTGFDPGTAEIEGTYLRWTVYTPMATPESTGITGQPSAGGPWLMFPGTPGSHIMITPPRGGGR